MPKGGFVETATRRVIVSGVGSLERVVGERVDGGISLVLSVEVDIVGFGVVGCECRGGKL